MLTRKKSTFQLKRIMLTILIQWFQMDTYIIGIITRGWKTGLEESITHPEKENYHFNLVSILG